MLASMLNTILETITDVSQNPVSIFIFLLLGTFIIFLLLAIIFPSWRDSLVRVKILEDDESPASLLLWIIGIIILVKCIQAFLIQPFIVDGASMVPTYHNKEFLLLDKFSYIVGEPKRGDVMIFKLYEGNTNKYSGKYLIKRVIGLPNDRVVVQNGITTIYNSNNKEGFIIEEPYVMFKDFKKNIDTTLNNDQYFVMGDNRAQSYDSRDWGPLNKKDIKGQVLLRIFPISAMGYEPGQYSYTK